MKKTLIAALASLMLVGAISAVSGAPLTSTTGMPAIIGEGSAPIPLGAPTSETNSGAPWGK